jgi:hypothetical protein
MVTGRPRFPRLGAIVAAVAVILAAAGCTRHPLDEKITARNDLGFSLWLSDHAGDLKADDQRELNEARSQIKLAVMTDAPGLPAEEFTRAVYAEIYGRTAREVLLRGIEIQAARIAAEIDQLQQREDNYRQIDATRLSPAACEFLEGFKARMAQRRTALQRLEERKTFVLAR